MSNYMADTIDALRNEIHKADPGCPDSLLPFYAQLVFTTGSATTSEHVHDAWSAWTVGDRPDHSSLVPFADLSPEVQAYDDLYRDAIVAVARGRAR